MTEPVRLAPLETSRLDEAARLSGAVGWPHRREDWALNLSLGGGVAALEGNALVGAAIASFFGAAHATINLVIVDKRLRGSGLGKRLTQAALEACAGREVRLVATRDGLPLYEKLGFEILGPIAQHQASARVEVPACGVAWAQAQDFDAILDLDRRATGMDRAALLDRLARDGRLALARRSGATVGYGAVRDFGRGAVVGPVAARDEAAARDLIAFLLASRPGGFLRVDTPEAGALSPWLERLGLPQVGGGLAMRRPAPGGGLAPTGAPEIRTYALASQALG